MPVFGVTPALATTLGATLGATGAISGTTSAAISGISAGVGGIAQGAMRAAGGLGGGGPEKQNMAPTTAGAFGSDQGKGWSAPRPQEEEDTLPEPEGISTAPRLGRAGFSVPGGWGG